MKKLGTIMEINTGIGAFYVTDNGALTANVSSAKIYRATRKVLNTIAEQTQRKFAFMTSDAPVAVTQIERWSDDYAI